MSPDFVAGEGGLKTATHVDSVTFLASNLTGTDSPNKGTRITLTPSPGGPSYKLQFWLGGLLPDGITYEFEAVDASYKG